MRTGARKTRCSLLILACALAGGCSCGEPGGASDDDDDGQCSDEDGDGRGVGDGCLGPDCDDSNPDVWADVQCDALCEEDPHSTGCPCDRGKDPEPETCYQGPEGTLGIGLCHSGLRHCTAEGVWSSCEGQVVPTDEVCDGEDDDCDGEVDQGVTNECGTCGECERSCSGPEEGCEDWGDDQTGLVETPEGWLTLDGTSISHHVIWPSSTSVGDIYRVDTRTFEIEAAFWTGPLHGERVSGGWPNGRDGPSRTAVDGFGNVIIANRGFAAQGSITKILANPDVCPDADGNGRVETSTRWDDRLPFDSHDDWDDECIVWHTSVGDVGAVVRALAIHRTAGLDGAVEERGWAGMHARAIFYEFETESGELTGRDAPTPGYTPYGAAIDRDGTLWMSGWPDNRVGRFDTSDPEDSFEALPLPGAGAQALRIIIDENNVPWISGTDVFQWDPVGEAFLAAGIAAAWSQIGGIASDGEGHIWVGKYGNGEFVHKIENTPDMEWERVDTPGTSTFGIGLDLDGHVWAFGWTANTHASVINLDDESTEVILDDCGGTECLSWPYLRGDIGGSQNATIRNPRGIWKGVFAGCVEETDWKRVVIDALTPAETAIVVQARTAIDLAALAAQPWTGIGQVPADGNALDLDEPFAGAGIEDADYLEVQVELQSLDGDEAPTLRGVEVQYACPDVIG